MPTKKRTVPRVLYTRAERNPILVSLMHNMAINRVIIVPHFFFLITIFLTGHLTLDSFHDSPRTMEVSGTIFARLITIFCPTSPPPAPRVLGNAERPKHTVKICTTIATRKTNKQTKQRSKSSFRRGFRRHGQDNHGNRH